MSEPKQRCCQEVFDGCHLRRCRRDATVVREGNGYCGIHDPVAIATRDAARRAEWAAQSKARAAQWRLERQAPAMLAFIKKVEDDCNWQVNNQKHLSFDHFVSLSEQARKIIADAEGGAA